MNQRAFARFACCAAGLWAQLAFAASPESTATFYQDCNYGGYAVSLGVGSYDAAALAAAGIRDNDLSSLRLFNGFKATLYDNPDLSGASASYAGNDDCLAPEGWNDRVSSLKIEKVATSSSGNPIFPGWYADPEAHAFGDTYWVYPTFSAPYEQQTFLDAFSSPDLTHWTKHDKVLSIANVGWATRAVWAPTIIQKDDKYYLFFAANDIQENTSTVGGIGVAVADAPQGPFVDLLGHPLVGTYQNGAQPIDPMVFQDVDGAYYLYYGGHGHCNVVRLDPSFTKVVPLADGTLYKEITPAGYVEGPFMAVRDGKYYFMWSEGAWTGPDYSVAYAMGASATGPFTPVGKILQQDASIATGAGHHSVMKAPGSDQWYIVYHRRPLDQTDGNAREVAIETLRFNADGTIAPVVLTTAGVAKNPVRYGKLVGDYFNGMNFEEPAFTRADPAVNFDWGAGSPGTGVQPDAFSVRWRGKVVPAYTQEYTFYVNSDNGRRLWIGGQLVIDGWVDDWGTEYTGKLKLKAGQSYDLRLDYFEDFGGASAKLEWSSKSQARELVPFTK